MRFFRFMPKLVDDMNKQSLVACEPHKLIFRLVCDTSFSLLLVPLQPYITCESIGVDTSQHPIFPVSASKSVIYFC